MKSLTPKKIAVIVGCLIAAFVVNWLLWLVIMGHPTDIAWAYQALNTICLATAFVVIADRFLKVEIFR